MDFDNCALARRLVIKVSCISNILPSVVLYTTLNQMENSLVTYGFKNDREEIGHLKCICDFFCLAICIYLYSTLHSLPVTIGIFTNSCYIYFVLNSGQSSGKTNSISLTSCLIQFIATTY